MVRFDNEQIYLDLEKQAIEEKTIKAILWDIQSLVKNYPNDAQLGAAVRKYLSKQHSNK